MAVRLPKPRPISKLSMVKSDRLHKTLDLLCPDLTEKTRTTVCVDLADFWEICEKHRLRVREIEKMRKPSDRRRLAKLLTDLLYEDVHAHLWYHERSMKRTLPGVIEKIEKKLPRERKP